MGELTWHVPSRDDIDDWVTLLAAIEDVDQRGEILGRDELEDEFDSVWSDPEHNSTFVRDGGELVGFGWLQVRPGSRGHHRISCWGGVHPKRRGEGIGRQILAWEVERAGEVAPTLDAALPVHLEAEIGDQEVSADRLVRRFGFEPVRWFVELQRRLDEELPEVSLPEGMEIRPWDESLDDASRLAHAESFADHWGSEPRTPEEWRQWYTGHRGFRPDLSYVAMDGEEVAAICLVAAYPVDWEPNGYRDAWINTLGTRQPWRGRGVARALLVTSMRSMQHAPDGFERATLGADTENPTGAVGLYDSLGFGEVRRIATLRRDTP